MESGDGFIGDQNDSWEGTTVMALCLAIDPGNEYSGWVVFEPMDGVPNIKILDYDKSPNNLVRLLCGYKSNPDGTLVVETPRSQGMPASNQLFETCVWVGRFLQAWGGYWTYAFRDEIKLYMCGSAKARDANVRQSLVERWGGQNRAIGGKKCLQCHGKITVGKGKEKRECDACKNSPGWWYPPGPLHGIAADVWAALAVAVSWSAKRDLVHTIERKVRME